MTTCCSPRHFAGAKNIRLPRLKDFDMAKFANIPSRREILRYAASASMFGIVAGQMDVAKPAFANEEKLTGPLNVLAWNGYDDPQLIQGPCEGGSEADIRIVT